jgi:hypothetical protein
MQGRTVLTSAASLSLPFFSTPRISPPARRGDRERSEIH